MSLLFQIAQANPPAIPAEILLLILVLGVLIFIWDLFDRRSKGIQEDAGLSTSSEVLAVAGSSYLPGKEYSSKELGLSGKPDALVREDGFIIPVDIKPMTQKVRDRHIVQLLAHLRLIEETEGVRPPYGILIMGKKGRVIHVKNTDDKQRWLQTLIDEMHSIMDGVPAVPAPAPLKCKSCDVRELCKHSAYTSDTA